MSTQIRTVKEPKGLAVGAQVPNFEAKDLFDQTFQLSEALKKGCLVVIFYRGQWCPLCNKHLKAVEKRLEEIYAKGAQVVAVSPERSEFLKMTAEKTKASFQLLFDEDYAISRLFDLDFKPSLTSRMMYNKLLGANLKKAHSDDSERLPIPATYIIDQQGKVIWRHFDPDYKKRSSVGDIFANLP